MRNAIGLTALVVTTWLGCTPNSPLTNGGNGTNGGTPDPGPGATTPGTTTPTPATGMCNIDMQGGPGASVAGWCVSGPGRMVMDAASVTVASTSVDGQTGMLVRFDRSTGAQTLLVGHSGDPSADGTLADGGDELFFGGVDANQHSSIFAVPRIGGSVRVVAASAASVANTYGRIYDLTVDAANVYWITDGIWIAPRAGGTARRLGDGGTTTGQLDAGIAVDGTAVYVTRPSDGVVARQPLDGSAGTVLASGRAWPSRIVVANDGTIYWLEVGALAADCSPSNGAVTSWSNGTLQSAASNVSGLNDFAVAGGKLVYVDEGAVCNLVGGGPFGSVNQLMLPNGAATQLGALQFSPRHVVTDGSDVYWTVESPWDRSGAIVHARLP